MISSGGTVGSNTPTSSPKLLPSTPATTNTPTTLKPTSTRTESPPLITDKPSQTSILPPAKTVPLVFDLNDFVTKGLPASAALPSGNVDQVAATMARQILKSDEQSLPVLLTALQAAGFTVIDETEKVLLRPADGKGQGLGFYDFEAVGSLKLAKSGVSASLEKITGTITKRLHRFPLRSLRNGSSRTCGHKPKNSDNAYLRFWARLIIELGKSSDDSVDLMTAPASHVKLSMLQATMLTRRLQGAIYTRKRNLNQSEYFTRRFLCEIRSLPLFGERMIYRSCVRFIWLDRALHRVI